MPPMDDHAAVTINISTEIGRANAERVTLRGRDLASELMGVASYTDALLLAVTGRRPSAAEVSVTDAVLVGLIDHGMQPSALAARMTYYAAPDAVQGAMAAGLLGAGSTLLGAVEQAGETLARVDDLAAGTAEGDAVATVIDGILDAGRRIPGFGHGLHRTGDPRADRLLRLAAGEGVAESERRRLELIAAHVTARTGRPLAPNIAGVAGALLLAVGVPWQLHRGIAIISRAAGLLAHIGEEMAHPVTPEVRRALRATSWLDDGL